MMCPDFKNVSDSVYYCQLRNSKLPISISLEMPRFWFELTKLEMKKRSYNNDLGLWLTAGWGY